MRAVLNSFWARVISTPPMSVAWPIWPHIKAPRPLRNSRKFSITAGSLSRDPIGALAHLQFGRAYALSGDKTKAKSAYQDFLALWKDARPRHPYLEAGQSRVCKAVIVALL